jgi:hypothetical protein
MKNVDLNKIPQKSIRTFIQAQLKNNINAFSDLKSTYTIGEDLSKFHIHQVDYEVPYALDTVWRHYLTANPSKVWNGNMLSFGLMVSKYDGEIMYTDGEYSAAKVGQVFYINLNILGGLIKLPVAHEIIAIEPEKFYFELSYIEGRKNLGKQRIAFSKASNGHTEIVHTTYYISDSKFRDRYIYPYFHSKAIGEWHQNMADSMV